jgi:hypothetical protein
MQVSVVDLGRNVQSAVILLVARTCSADAVPNCKGSFCGSPVIPLFTPLQTEGTEGGSRWQMLPPRKFINQTMICIN